MVKENDARIKKKSKIEPDLKEVTNSELASELRRNIKREQKRFKKLLESNSPDINKQEVFSVFNKRSSRNTKKLVNLATQALAMVNSVYYANKAISNTLGAEDTAFNLADFNKHLVKIVEVKIAQLICEEFKIASNYEKEVIYGIIGRVPRSSLKQGNLNGQTVIAAQASRGPAATQEKEKKKPR